MGKSENIWFLETSVYNKKCSLNYDKSLQIYFLCVKRQAQKKKKKKKKKKERKKERKWLSERCWKHSSFTWSTFP